MIFIFLKYLFKPTYLIAFGLVLLRSIEFMRFMNYVNMYFIPFPKRSTFEGKHNPTDLQVFVSLTSQYEIKYYYQFTPFQESKVKGGDSDFP